jgi:hypothetical protein
MKEARERAAITQSSKSLYKHVFNYLNLDPIFPMCHTDSNIGELFCNSCRETSVPPLKITDHVQGHIIHSEHPTGHSCFNEALYVELQ